MANIDLHNKEDDTGICDHPLHIEDEPRFTGEDYGWYIIMCSECGWCDKTTFSNYDEAVIRLAELNAER